MATVRSSARRLLLYSEDFFFVFVFKDRMRERGGAQTQPFDRSPRNARLTGGNHLLQIRRGSPARHGLGMD